MSYYRVEPAVPGGLGRRTVMSRETHPPIVSHLHYEFDDWPDDDLNTAFPCFIVKERLAAALSKSGFTGFELRDLETSISGQFRDWYGPAKSRRALGKSPLPKFQWLVLSGEPGRDDFAPDAIGDLIVSQRALELLKSFTLDDCIVKEYKSNSSNK
jgi:hypothetical protein